MEWGKIIFLITLFSWQNLIQVVHFDSDIYYAHFLDRILDSKKTSHFQFSGPGLREIHRNLKQQKNFNSCDGFFKNPLFVLIPA